MATANFYKKNASYYYVVELTDDDFLNIELIKNIAKKLEEKLGYVDVSEYKEYLDNGWVIAEEEFCVNEEKNYDYYICGKIKILVRSGYYSDCNLDYSFEFVDCFNNVITDDDLEEFFDFYYDYLDNEKEKKIMYKLRDKAYKLFKKEIEKLEKKLFEITIPLEKVATFSNGETIYRRVKS